MSYWDVFRREGPEPAYLRVCEAIAEGIRTGKLRPGQRLPSHRMLARRLGLSVGTITRAYEEVLHRGLITGQVGRGSFVRYFVAWPLTVVNARRLPPDCADLLQNLPVRGEVEEAAWAEALDTLRRRGDLSETSRTSWSEMSERRERAGAAWIARLGLDVPHRQVRDCPGVMPALSAILGAVAQPRDLVLAACLSHPLIRMLAEQYSLKIHGLPLDEEGIVPSALAEACEKERPRLLYCAPTLHTPTLGTMSAARREEIASIARKYDVVIVEDEHAGFLLPDPLPPIASFAPDHTFLIADTWMALSLGLRTAYIVAPEPFADRFARTLAASSGTAVPLLAEVASHWIETGAADRLIEARRSELIVRNGIARSVLGRHRIRSHELGHHVWLEIPPPLRSETFVHQALQAGVAVQGGAWFVIEPFTAADGVRIALGNAPNREILRSSVERLARFVATASVEGARDTN